MMIWLPLGLGALLLAGAVFLQRRRRRTRLARFRAEWGQASERERDMPPISLYHRTLAPPDECPLDERTGRDLDLDAVFATLDRTESAVGQQLLYHRLRTTPTSDSLAGFEAIMTRLSQDATERERIQLALARLRGASGDLWWLTQPGVLDANRRDLVFPILAPVVPVALLLSTVWPLAVGVVIVGVLTNWTLRYLTAPRIGPLLHPFRQLEPLIGAAQTVCPVMTGGGAPLGPGLGGRHRQTGPPAARGPLDQPRSDGGRRPYQRGLRARKYDRAA